MTEQNTLLTTIEKSENLKNAPISKAELFHSSNSLIGASLGKDTKIKTTSVKNSLFQNLEYTSTHSRKKPSVATFVGKQFQVHIIK